MSPPWSDATKRWVATAGAILIALGLYTVRDILPSFILASVLAFLLNPIVDFLSYRAQVRRIFAGAIVYLALVSLIILPFLFVPNLVGRLTAAIPDAATLQAIVQGVTERLSEVEAFGLGPNLAVLLQEPLSRFGELFRSTGGATLSLFAQFTRTFASTLVGLVFTLVASFYLVTDTPRIVPYLMARVPVGYERDALLLGAEMHRVWAGFFRGQLILCLAIGIVTGLTMWAVGVPYAFWLGVVAGVLEIVPNLGPVLASIPSIAIALFQGPTRFDMSHLWFAVLVALLYILIQQAENNYFVPRIIGASVNLHPVVTLGGVLVGANLAGILGIFLAAPTIATLRIIFRYAYLKVQDRDPFPSAAQPTVADMSAEPAPPGVEDALAAPTGFPHGRR